jgi:hypothetical protein
MDWQKESGASGYNQSMRIESKTVTVEYNVFDVGERVCPASSECPLPPGIYTVTKYLPPTLPYEQSGVVFLEGHKTGLLSENFDTAFPDSDWD